MEKEYRKRITEIANELIASNAELEDERKNRAKVKISTVPTAS